MSMRVCVTGGLGFIGVNLIRYLQDHTDWSLCVLDDYSSSVVDGLDDVEVFKGSVLDEKLLGKVLDGVDGVFHLAGNCGVIRSLDDPVFDMRENIRGTLNLLSVCKQCGVSRFVFSSSNAVLGMKNVSLVEDMTPVPVSPYGVSKLAAESYCRVLSSSDFRVRVCRLSNVYGPWSQKKTSVIPLFIKQILDDELVVVFGDGSQTRDFVFVDDVCQGLFRSFVYDGGVDFELFQIGSGQCYSINYLLSLLKKDVGKDFEVVYKSFRRGEVRDSVSCIGKAGSLLGYDPLVGFDCGVEKTVWSFLDRRCG